MLPVHFGAAALDVPIAVIGDLMLDRYVHGAVTKFSPEDPNCMILSQDEGVELKPGGAANVACNLVALGAHVHLIGCGGSGMYAQQLEGAIRKSTEGLLGSIELHLAVGGDRDTPRRTTVKTRYCTKGRQLLRVDSEERTKLSWEEQESLNDAVFDMPMDVKMIVLSDYAKGVLTDDSGPSPFRPGLIRMLQDKDWGGKWIVDPKGSDFDYGDSPLVMCPNESEHVQNMMGKAENVVVTRGDKGCALIPRDPFEVIEIPSPGPVDMCDPVGAGDVFIAALAMALAVEMNVKEACHLANVAARRSVMTRGTAIVTAPELLEDLKEFPYEGADHTPDGDGSDGRPSS